ncbi:hypothetical protein U7230_07160 [Carboxydochorda subterranea]|uniref:Uncharacterized protein n=1 Tax=Carboxydichorda subterranea TaxID=3109565 RepID=A0ABZ1C432_9FIRM|nr:hypothetical protein [Limnochorda sp. L945t]WRP18763.1 hypothetical protein U7230_07160 [Limnochorda sp. L945t]
MAARSCFERHQTYPGLSTAPPRHGKGRKPSEDPALPPPHPRGLGFLAQTLPDRARSIEVHVCGYNKERSPRTVRLDVSGFEPEDHGLRRILSETSTPDRLHSRVDVARGFEVPALAAVSVQLPETRAAAAPATGPAAAPAAGQGQAQELPPGLVRFGPAPARYVRLQLLERPKQRGTAYGHSVWTAGSFSLWKTEVLAPWKG